MCATPCAESARLFLIPDARRDTPLKRLLILTRPAGCLSIFAGCGRFGQVITPLAHRHWGSHTDGRADDRRHTTPDGHAGALHTCADRHAHDHADAHRLSHPARRQPDEDRGAIGVSVRSLQDINGITDPRALRVGQELLIPGAEDDPEGAGATPTSEATPLPFVVENVTFSNSSLGGLWAFGEIHNTTGTDLEQAGLRSRFRTKGRGGGRSAGVRAGRDHPALTAERRLRCALMCASAVVRQLPGCPLEGRTRLRRRLLS